LQVDSDRHKKIYDAKKVKKLNEKARMQLKRNMAAVGAVVGGAVADTAEAMDVAHQGENY